MLVWKASDLGDETSAPEEEEGPFASAAGDTASALKAVLKQAAKGGVGAAGSPALHRHVHWIGALNLLAHFDRSQQSRCLCGHQCDIRIVVS
eukprot:scaffold61876_cov17-Prasinocladus_malaysianus.AAC.1